MNLRVSLPAIDRPDTIVCRCLGVTEEDLLRALTTEQIRTLNDLRACTGAGGGCMCCIKRLKAFLQRHAPAVVVDPDPVGGRRRPLPAVASA